MMEAAILNQLFCIHNMVKQQSLVCFLQSTYVEISLSIPI